MKKLTVYKKVAGLAVVALLFGGWGAAAHAQVCYSANCTMRIDEAYDPGYQAAIHSGWSPMQYGYGYNAPYSSYSPYGYGGYPYSTTPYYQGYSSNYQYQYQYQYQYSNQYSNQYSYQYQPRTSSYWQNGCLITTIRTNNGTVQTTRAC